MLTADLIVQRPTDVFQIRIVQKIGRKLDHPNADFGHANAPDFGQRVSISVHEYRFEHIRQHVLYLLHVLLELSAFRHQ